jgi:hypothetical protein
VFTVWVEDAQADWDDKFAALTRPPEALRLEFSSLDEAGPLSRHAFSSRPLSRVLLFPLAPRGSILRRGSNTCVRHTPC